MANVNVHADGRLKVNVNRFDNPNVWNAKYAHRLVVPQLVVFSCLSSRSFTLQTLFPSAKHSADFLKFLRDFNVFIGVD